MAIILRYFAEFGSFHGQLRTSRSAIAIVERPRCWVRYSLGQKWKTGTRRQYFTDINRSIFNHCDIIGLKICQIRRKKTQNKDYYGVQGHSRLLSPEQSKTPMRLFISD